MNRICPKCKEKLGSNDNYFCSNCGNMLPDNLVLSKYSVREDYLKETEQIKKRDFLRSFISLCSISYIKKTLLYTILALVFGFFITLLFKGNSPLVYGYLNSLFYADADVNVNRFADDSLKIEEKVSNELNSNIKVKSDEFHKNYLSDYVPYDADVFIEVNDFDSFLKLFISQTSTYEVFSKLEGSFENNFGIFIKEYPILLDDTDDIEDTNAIENTEDTKDTKELPYKEDIVTYNNFVWTYILFPKEESSDLVIDVLNELNYEENGIYFEFLDSSLSLDQDFLDNENKDNRKVLIISNNKSSIEDCINSKKQLIKNLSVNPMFMLSQRTLNNYGQVYFLILSPKGKDFVKTFSSYNLPKDMKSLFDLGLNSMYDYGVIVE